MTTPVRHLPVAIKSSGTDTEKALITRIPRCLECLAHRRGFTSMQLHMRKSVSNYRIFDHTQFFDSQKPRLVLQGTQIVAGTQARNLHNEENRHKK